MKCHPFVELYTPLILSLCSKYDELEELKELNVKIFTQNNYRWLLKKRSKHSDIIEVLQRNLDKKLDEKAYVVYM